MARANKEAIVSYAGGQSMVITAKAGGAPTRPVHRNVLDQSQEIEYWGADNLEPQHILADVASNPLLGPALQFQVKALYAGTLLYGYEEVQQGEWVFVPQKIPQIDRLLACSGIANQLIRGFQDIKFLNLAFPELILSRDRKSVAMVNFLQAAYCRWSKQASDGRHQQVYVDANWELRYGRVDHQYTHKIPVLADFPDALEALKYGKENKYVLAGIHYPMPGITHYPGTIWNPLRASGWLKYANQIPQFKSTYLENATHIKYIAHVPMSWWKWKYEDWDDLEDKEREQLVKKEHLRFDKFLRGVKNAGKSLILTYKDDMEMKKHGYTKWEVELLDKKVIDGILKDDVLETTQMIYSAVGVHGTLLGSTPGGTEAGSGSNQREAFNIFKGLSQFDQEIVLRPFELAAAYNGFPNLKFRFRDKFLANLSEVSPKQRRYEDDV